jgi:hypothetical protein
LFPFSVAKGFGTCTNKYNLVKCINRVMTGEEQSVRQMVLLIQTTVNETALCQSVNGAHVWSGPAALYNTATVRARLENWLGHRDNEKTLMLTDREERDFNQHFSTEDRGKDREEKTRN